MAFLLAGPQGSAGSHGKSWRAPVASPRLLSPRVSPSPSSAINSPPWGLHPDDLILSLSPAKGPASKQTQLLPSYYLSMGLNSTARVWAGTNHIQATALPICNDVELECSISMVIHFHHIGVNYRNPFPIAMSDVFKHSCRKYRQFIQPPEAE